jgi:alkanesulfonate monooxygenase SsuD/methylene tetrahydromethanopterin reductase-like flavin-dependent oxidoreductase (luciferase family)
VAALLRYRAEFRPSSLRTAPHAIVAVAVVCGESDAHADDLATSGDLGWVRFGQGLRDLPMPSVEEARAYVFDEEEEQVRRMNRARSVVGGPSLVGELLRALVRDSRADEVMATTGIHDHEERKRSYDRLFGALNAPA